MTNKLPAFSILWKETIERYSAQSQMMLTIGALAGLPLVALSFVPYKENLQNIIFIVGLYILSTLWVAFSTIAIYAAVTHPEVQTVGAAYTIGLRRAATFIAAQVLQGLLILGPIAAIVGAIAVYYFSTGKADIFDRQDMAVFGVALLITFIGVIIVSIWAYRFTFAGFIVFEENKGAVDALRSSYALTNKRIREIWQKFFVYSLIAVSISITISIVNGIATGLLADGSMAVNVVNTLFNFFENMVLIPLSVLFTSSLYKAIKAANAAQPATV